MLDHISLTLNDTKGYIYESKLLCYSCCSSIGSSGSGIFYRRLPVQARVALPPARSMQQRLMTTARTRKLKSKGERKKNAYWRISIDLYHLKLECARWSASRQFACDAIASGISLSCTHCIFKSIRRHILYIYIVYLYDIARTHTALRLPVRYVFYCTTSIKIPTPARIHFETCCLLLRFAVNT